MKKFNFETFKTSDEITALGDYINQNWTGLTPEQAQKVAELGFMRAWDSYGERFMYPFYQGKQISGIEIGMAREKTLQALGYSFTQAIDDGVCKVLFSVDNLARYQEEETSFSSQFKTLVKDAKALLGTALTKARPAGWDNKPAPYSLEGASQEQMDSFQGTVTSSGTGPTFLDAVAVDNVKDFIDDYKPHETLLWALYGHGVLVRRKYNDEALGHYLMAIDSNQPYVGPGSTVKLQASPVLENLYKKAAKSDHRAESAAAVIEWVQPPALEAPGL